MIFPFANLSLSLAALASALPVQAPGETCTLVDEALPAALAGWRSAAPLSGPAVPIGRAVRVRLAPAAEDTFETKVSVRVRRAGRYEIALSEPAWIDLIRDGETLSSIAHRHDQFCSTVRKIVSFDLAPGTYTLRLTRSPAPTATLAILAF